MYYSITATPEYRELERIREKARYEEAQALYTAKKEGREEGRKEVREEEKEQGRKEEKIAIVHKLLKNKFSIEEIMEYTELSYEEIEHLQSAFSQSK